MRVVEKNTDRKAEVHIHVNGKVDALEEYGQYVDPVDEAICCYIPVEEGHEIRIKGTFSGTTLTIVYDAVVDGVFCKASSSTAKTVHHQKNKKIDIEKFLYKLKNEIIDTNLSVGPLLGVTTSRGEASETIGAIELRVYITRQLSVFHSLEGAEKYFAKKGNLEDDMDEIAYYKQIEPQFQMAFEKNCAPLEKGKVNRELKKMNAPRPGTKPWAVFRFYYRAKDAIDDQGLKLTYGPLSKAIIKPHDLVLEVVPPLVAGTKLYKDDGDSSTQASSMPPESPSTPLKSTRKECVKTPAPAPKQQPKVTATASRKDPKSTLDTESAEKFDNIRARLFSKASNMNGDSDKMAAISAGTTTKDSDTIVVNTSTKLATQNPADNSKSAGRDNVAVVIPKKLSGLAKDSTAKTSTLTPTSAKQANGITPKSASQDKETAKVTTEPPVMPDKKPHGVPAPINTATPAVQEKPPTPIILVASTKRAGTPTNDNDAEVKRTRIDTAVPTPSMLPLAARVPSGSPEPSTMRVERKVVEQRKKLEAMRQKRQEMAKKQLTLEEEMGPYKDRMAKELERLEKETMAEEAAFNEEKERYKTDLEILNEFKVADSET